MGVEETFIHEIKFQFHEVGNFQTSAEQPGTFTVSEEGRSPVGCYPHPTPIPHQITFEMNRRK